MKLKVKDNPGLVRDSKSKAIVNVDVNAFSEYQNKKTIQNKMINMSEEINELKQSMTEIKSMLSQILQRTN